MKKIVLALAAASAALAASTGALAHDRDRDHARGWNRGHDERHFRHYAPRPVFVAPARRVFYAPAPRVVYAPAYPVVVRPAPVYSTPGVSIRFDLPL
ncbi:MAG TPA: hypothetical protein VFV74_03255 [Burkholderiales bacterium]|nr:hypothetical protein [Burkholderiales bacterium]